MNIVETIFRETAAHQRITHKMEVALGRPPALEPYEAILQRLYGLYFPFELQFDGFASAREWQEVCLPLSERRKVPLLERDLSALGVPAGRLSHLPLCEEWPPLDSVPRILGALCVVEGSTLGGQVIAGRLEAALFIDPRTGSAFFRSYGPERVPTMWEEYCRALNAFAAGHDQDASSIVKTAVDVFLLIERWLFPEAVSGDAVGAFAAASFNRP